MKVLMLNGSSKANGNTYQALSEIGMQLEKEGIAFEIFQIGGEPVRDCIGCGQCNESGCVFSNDVVNEFIQKAKEADGFVFGTPVYYAHSSGRILAFLDRVFCSSIKIFEFKPAAAISVARRGGCTSAIDDINKYFAYSQMPIVPSTYWNLAYGAAPGQVQQDEEGLATMRNLGRNMAWMLKCFAKGKEMGIEIPKTERGIKTNFIK